MVVLLCLTGLACQRTTGQPGAGFPEPEDARHVLAAGQDPHVWVARPEPTTAAAPLTVTQAGPQTEVEGTAAITVTFSRPMVALGAAPASTDGRAFPIVIEPPVAAHYRWVAGDTLKVALSEPLKNAHVYRVTVPGGTRGLHGPPLAEDYSWTFHTPRPELRDVSRWPLRQLRGDRLLPTDSLRLRFNMKVDPTEVRRALRLVAGGAELSYGIERHRGDPTRVLVTPDQPLPLATKVTVRVGEGLRSLEGPVGSAELDERSFETPHPLSAQAFCGAQSLDSDGVCLPTRDRNLGHPLRLVLSEPVCRKDLVRALRIQPRPAKLREGLSWNGRMANDDHGNPCSRRWTLDGDLIPRRAHRLEISTSLKDIFGQHLAQPYVAKFKTRGYPPGLFLTKDDRIQREKGQPYVVKTINVSQVEVKLRTFRGAELVRFAECAKATRDWAADCPEGGLETRLVLPVRAGPDQLGTVRVPLPVGLVAMTLSSPEVVLHDGKRVEFRRLALQSDVGIHARLTPFGLTAWLTSLRSDRALGQAEVTIFDLTGQQLHQAKPNAAGVLEVPRSAFGQRLSGTQAPKLYVLARDGSDEAYLRLPATRRYGDDDDDPFLLQTWELGSARSWQGDRPKVVGTVSTERGIYRPGQTVHIQGAVRIYRTWKPAPAAGQEATVRLQLDGQVLATQQVTLSSFGAFHLRLPLPREGRLGRHDVVVQVQGDTIARHPFKVSEYRAPQFRVAARPTPTEVLATDKLTISAAAEYLFGGAMGGAAYRVSLTRSYDSTGLGGHRVGCFRLPEQRQPRSLHRDGALGPDGKMTEVIDLGQDVLDKPCPVALRGEVEVRSADRQTVAATTWSRQWPAAIIAGLEDMPATGTSLRKQIFVHRWSSPAPARTPVTATVHELRDRTVDWSRHVFRKELEVGPRGALLEIPWPDELEQDSAFLVLAVRDEAGRLAWTTDAIYRPRRWDQEQAERNATEERRQQQLTITLDKDEYLPGEVATVTVTRRGPAGQGLLLVERERIFHTIPLRFDAAGRATARIEVAEAFARSVTVRAVLSRHGNQLRRRDGPLAAASESLAVSSAPFRLAAEVKTDRDTYRPGETVKVAVAVRDGLNRPHRSQVVLMAVDESVLRLTRYGLPNPFYGLFHTPADTVLADDVRRSLAPLRIDIDHVDHGSLGLSGIGEGGGGRGEGIGLGSVGTIGHGVGGGRLGKKRKTKPRETFLTTAWHASVVTDTQGLATASFALPDNLTEYRIMAFVVDAERAAGRGETRFRVDLPVAALPALPRLARVGDRFEAGVVLYNSAQPPGPARVTARVEGKTIALQGSAERRVTLGTGEEREVTFSFEATGAGPSKLAFEVTMGSLTDQVVETLEVHRAALMEATSVSGRTQGAVRQAIAPLGSLMPGRGGLEVSLSSTALSGVEDGLEQLVGYPYGCLEQKSSKLLGLIGAVVLSHRFGSAAPGKAQGFIQPALDEILALQRKDGGFGYWPGSTDSSVWGTAYALIVLHRAQRSSQATGAVVPPEAVERAATFLEPHAGTSSWGRYSFAYRASVIYALALSGRDVESHALWLHQHRRRQPLFARAMLLSALQSQKHNARVRQAVEQLTRELSDHLRIDGPWAHAEENLHDGYQVLMHSDDRTTAMVLLALVPGRQLHPMVPRLVRWFLQGRKQARYRNTQEAAWALMALWDYADRWEKEVPDFEAGVWLGQKRLVSALFQGRQVRPRQTKVPMSQLLRSAGTQAADLVVGKKGKGTLYYVARLRYAHRELPQKPRDHGFAVHRTVQVLDGAGRVLAQQRAPRLGDTLLVTVTASAPEARRYVVIDDPLPAGVEALDTSLATASQSFGAAATQTGSDPYDHRELRDDRVLFFRDLMQPGKLTYRYLARVTTAGRFVVPPTKAEEMYNPEIFGHNAAARVRYEPTAGGSGGRPAPAMH